MRNLHNKYAEFISKSGNERGCENELWGRGRAMEMQPGYVIKGSASGGSKVFVNVCKGENVGKPSSAKQVGDDGRAGLTWTLPHSITQLRDDAKQRCKVFDFVIHPDTYRMAETNGRFKKMLNELAIDGIRKEFGVDIDTNKLRFPKMKYKGVPSSAGVKSPISSSQLQKTCEEILKKLSMKDDKSSRTVCEENGYKKTEVETEQKSEMNTPDIERNNYVMPKYRIEHKEDNSSKALVVHVELPLVSSAALVTLDVMERNISLLSLEPSRYKLDLPLSCRVDENHSSAKFVKSKRLLIIKLPVLFENATAHTNNCTQINTNNICHTVSLNTEECEEKAVPNCSLSTGSEVDSRDASIDSECCKTTDTVKEIETNLEDGRSSVPDGVILMPPFNCRQDLETVTFIFHVPNVIHDSLSFVKTSQSEVVLKMNSIDEQGIASNYSCCLKFEDGDAVSDDDHSLDITHSNVVLVMMKDSHSHHTWTTFWAGVNLKEMEEKEFLTGEDLMNALDKLDAEREQLGSSGSTDAPGLQVTEMSGEKLVVVLEKTDKEANDDKVQADIVIVHEKVTPKLHGILKQRTVSESSELSSYERQMSTTTGSDGDDSDSADVQLSSSCGSGRVLKKSVSFNDRVDRAMFQSNQSVSSMHTALKNRRRRARKRDQKMEQKQQQRRRTRSSGSVSMEDSGDERPILLRSASVPTTTTSQPSSISVNTKWEENDTKDCESDESPGKEDVFDAADASCVGAVGENWVEMQRDLETNSHMTSNEILNYGETLRTRSMPLIEDYGYKTLHSNDVNCDVICDKNATDLRDAADCSDLKLRQNSVADDEGCDFMLPVVETSALSTVSDVHQSSLSQECLAGLASDEWRFVSSESSPVSDYIESLSGEHRELANECVALCK